MKQLPLTISPPPATDFAHLVVGPNAHAVQHLRALRRGAAPVLLWGPAGSGKTRLLQALVAARRSEGEAVAWFDAGDPLPWVAPDDLRLVVLDGCERLDTDRQQAAFVLFVEALGRGALWAAAARMPPVDLPLREDLRTRLAWGDVFALAPLSEEETRSALRSEARRRGIGLSDEVLDYLMARFERHLGHLMALLDALDGYSLAAHRPVTVPLLKRMLAEGGTPA